MVKSLEWPKFSTLVLKNKIEVKTTVKFHCIPVGIFKVFKYLQYQNQNKNQNKHSHFGKQLKISLYANYLHKMSHCNATFIS
jgi:hypothetical protein